MVMSICTDSKILHMLHTLYKVGRHFIWPPRNLCSFLSIILEMSRNRNHVSFGFDTSNFRYIMAMSDISWKSKFSIFSCNRFILSIALIEMLLKFLLTLGIVILFTLNILLDYLINIWTHEVFDANTQSNSVCVHACLYLKTYVLFVHAKISMFVIM